MIASGLLTTVDDYTNCSTKFGLQVILGLRWSEGGKLCKQSNWRETPSPSCHPDAPPTHHSYLFARSSRGSKPTDHAIGNLRCSHVPMLTWFYMLHHVTIVLHADVTETHSAPGRV